MWYQKQKQRAWRILIENYETVWFPFEGDSIEIDPFRWIIVILQWNMKDSHQVVRHLRLHVLTSLTITQRHRKTHWKSKKNLQEQVIDRSWYQIWPDLKDFFLIRFSNKRKKMLKQEQTQRVKQLNQKEYGRSPVKPVKTIW